MLSGGTGVAVSVGVGVSVIVAVEVGVSVGVGVGRITWMVSEYPYPEDPTSGSELRARQRNLYVPSVKLLVKLVTVEEVVIRCQDDPALFV